jgi:hypothetical protein
MSIEKSKKDALNLVSGYELDLTRDITRLRARIHECTPESIREASEIEYDLTGGMEATTIIAIALNLPDFMDCDCYENQQQTKPNNFHLLGCKYYKEIT